MSKYQQHILQLLSKDGYRPLKRHELAKELNVQPHERPDFRKTLRTLEEAGKIVCIRKNRWALPDSGQHVTGILRMHAHGFGFVTADDKDIDDVYISEDGLGTALDRDHVQIEVRQSHRQKRSAKGQLIKTFEGRVIRVLEHNNTHVVGLLQKGPSYWFVTPDNPRILQDIKVTEFAKGVEPKKRRKVIVELEKRTHDAAPLRGTVIEDLGHIDESGVDMLSLIREFKLETAFTDEALKEAEAHKPEIPAHVIKERVDLREDVIFCIDPDDAKDFDDAISLVKKKDGGYVLGVHIADVAHYVTPGSAIDKDAYLRGNSVYLVDRALPMLPHYLTGEICSLKPHVEKLTHTAELHLDEEGKVVKSKTYQSVIRSKATLSYDQAQAFFDTDFKQDDGIPVEVRDVLKMLRPLVRTIRERRMKEGSIDFNMPEVKCKFDDKGTAIAIEKRGSSEAYQLIEECMLLANKAVAEKLLKADYPAIYRIHEEPDDEQWDKMAADLSALGVTLIPRTAHDINKIAKRARGQAAAYSIAIAILRNLKRAMYSPKNEIHFGLAFDHYTHFTSPIRRYSDLLVHRVLNAVENKINAPYPFKEFGHLVTHLNETERVADEASKESLDMKRLQYYEHELDKGNVGPFDATVTGIKKPGLLVELPDTLLRGLVPFSTMGRDYYYISDDGTNARGRRTNHTWTIGDQVRVKLARVDRVKRLVDFTLADMKDRAASSKGARKGKKPKKDDSRRGSKGKKDKTTSTPGDSEAKNDLNRKSRKKESKPHQTPKKKAGTSRKDRKAENRISSGSGEDKNEQASTRRKNKKKKSRSAIRNAERGNAPKTKNRKATAAEGKPKKRKGKRNKT